MLSKETRLNLTKLVFSYIFRSENNLEVDINDLLLASEDPEDNHYFPDIIERLEEYRHEVEVYLSEFGWIGTPYISKAILVMFCFEKMTFLKGQPELQAKVIAEYLHLTQDLAGSECVPLVHAVIGKLTQTSEQN
ncbi:MAG: hypothetical protein OHK0017_04530 [Patescibacteria group bacterium]